MPRWNDEDRTALSALRARAGLSMETAAGRLGITIRTLARYENAENDIPVGIMEQMSSLYEASFEDVRQAIRATKEAAGMRAVGRMTKNLAP